MTRWRRPAIGLLGRIFAILLVAVAFEFAASTFLYERASLVLVREDEARRLAEHLVIARKLMAERPAEQRPRMAAELTTDRYIVRWSMVPPLPPRRLLAPELDTMRSQVLAWEPGLARSDLRVRLTSPGRAGVAIGSLRLPDGSWMRFATTEHLHGWDLALGRIILALIPAAALIVIGGLLLRHMLTPLRRLASAAERIGHDRDEVALSENGPSEVRKVIRAFNAMQARIHRLLAERTEALAAAGHDLRTPLARLRLRVDRLGPSEAERAPLLADLDEMEAMLGSVLDYLGGEEEPERPMRTDLAVLMATLADDAQDRGFPATYDGPEHCERLCRPLALKRALSNLVENALHYAHGVELGLAETADGLVLRVEDRGPGIPAGDLEAVRRPFTRLDPARARNTSGLGLGLAIVTRVVEQEGGEFRLENRVGGGLSASIVLGPPPKQ